MLHVENALNSVADVGATASSTLASLSLKQDLLVKFLQHEISRLQVWLFPLAIETNEPWLSNLPDRAPLLVSSSAGRWLQCADVL